MAAGDAQLGHRRRQASLRHVVHGMDAGEAGRDARLGQDAQAFGERTTAGQLVFTHALSAEAVAQLRREHRCALHRHRLGEYDTVALLDSALLAQVGAAQHTEHRPRHDRPADGGGDLGVSADRRDALLAAGGGEVVEQAHRLGGGRTGGQQDGGQQPARLGAGRGDVVGVHRDRVTAEIGARERDRVAVRDDDLGARDVERGDVFAHRGADQHRGIGRVESAEERRQEVGRQLALVER